MIENQITARSSSRNRNLLKPVLYLVVIIIVALLPLFVKSPYMIHIFIMTLIYIIAAASLRTITISGQMPLAHAAFMGIGGYTAAILSQMAGGFTLALLDCGSLISDDYLRIYRFSLCQAEDYLLHDGQPFFWHSRIIGYLHYGEVDRQLQRSNRYSGFVFQCLPPRYPISMLFWGFALFVFSPCGDLKTAVSV